MKRFSLMFALAVMSMTAGFAHAGLLYNPVVTVIGDGTNTGSAGLTTTISLYSNTAAGQATPVSSVSYLNGAQTGQRLVNSYSATSEGTLANNPALSNAAAQGLPSTGGYTFSAGFDAADNTASIKSAGTDRSLGSVNVAAGSVSNATVRQLQSNANAYKGDNIRSGVGDDAVSVLYSAGNGSPSSTAGWRNFSTNTQLYSTTTNTRTVELLGTNLFGSTGSGSTRGIYLIDPSTSTATSYINLGSSASPYEFALFNDSSNLLSSNGFNVAYIADDGAGIRKWTLKSGGWSEDYVLSDSGKKYRGLAGQKDPTTGLITLFATTAPTVDANNELQQVTDTGSGSSFTTLATAPSNYIFRGVALAPVSIPEPSTVVLLGGVFFAAIFGIIRRKRS
jgi:hypothetical protein